MSTEGEEPMQKFELYIKASAIDKETKGADPICQQFFMITCLLGENQEDIDFKVFTVQADCPPKNFAAGWSKKYPVVMVNSGRNKAGQDISGMMYDTFEELETFFESINKQCPELKRKNRPNQDAMGVIENLYKHFNHFIAGQPEKGLVKELDRLNEYLEGQDTTFMVDNVLSFSDCHLLPRLQHIRVASKAYRDFEIPKEFTYLWKYLKNAYEQDAFKSTMPSDQDIVFFYEKKAKNPPKREGRKGGKPMLEKFTFTMDVPAECLSSLDNGDSQQEEEAVQEEEAQQGIVQEEETNGSDAAGAVEATVESEQAADEVEAVNGLPAENGTGDDVTVASEVTEVLEATEVPEADVTSEAEVPVVSSEVPEGSEAAVVSDATEVSAASGE